MFAAGKDGAKGAKYLLAILVSVAMTALVLVPEAASAHAGTGEPGGFASGFVHPLFGWDHVVAMVAVGLWGAFLGKPAIWLLPVTFPLVMVAGGILGIAGVGLPATEIFIALSGIVLGLLVALAVRLPLLPAMLIVGIFAIFHGHAHGVELPGAADPVTYASGFVLATGLLHLCGIAFGELAHWQAGRLAVRAGGVVIALVGGAFLAGWL